MKNRLKVAIIGGGLNSAVGYAHYSAIVLSNKFEIVCGNFSRNGDTNNKTAEVYGVTKLYDDYKVMLSEQKSNIDAVVILTPSDQHFEQLMYITELKIPIVCEKSLIANNSELQELKEKNKDNFIAVVFNYLCYPMLKELREIIKRGDLGKILQIQIEMPQEGFLKHNLGQPLKPQSWRLIDGEVPTLSLDLATHTYSIVKFLTEEQPIEVVAVENNFGNFENIVDDINCIIKYTNNMVCNMWYSKVALGNRNGLRVRIYGTNGSAEWYQLEPEVIHISDKTGKVSVVDRGSENLIVANQFKYNRFKVGHPVGFIEALANFYEDVYDDFHKVNDVKVTYGIEESEECIKLLEAISKSARNRNWIKI
jgi:predicted dehydrogenase